jgi:hypothetical protein
MKTTSNYKSIGGVESVALYPADAVAKALFSSEGCEVELSGTPIEVALIDDASHYEESSRLECGTTTVSHLLHLVAEMNDGEKWRDEQFLESAFFEGFVAVVTLCSGIRLLVGYSAKFTNEQPLRLDSITSASGSTPLETPSVTLRLMSRDTDFSAHIL